MELDLTEAQIATFQLRGNAHKLERLADSAAPAPVVEAAAPPPPAPVADSPFVALECPICQKEFNLVKMLAPGGSVETFCTQCGAALTIEHFTIVEANPRIPEALQRNGQ